MKSTEEIGPDPNSDTKPDTELTSPGNRRGFLNAAGRVIAKALGTAWKKTNEHLDKPAPKVSRRAVLLGGTSIAVGAFVEGRFRLIERLAEAPANPEVAPPPGKKTDVLIESDKFTTYVRDHKDLAIKLSDDPDRPLPYEAFLAVSMHESDSGTSELAKNANNFFGVIAKDGWTGQVYEKRTEEQIPKDQLSQYIAQHPDLSVLKDNGNNTLRVAYVRPFRKYNNLEESFRDFAKKIYFKNPNGTYRYADVVAYLQKRGRDPYKVIDLLCDDNEPGEARYATGAEWRTKVPTYIALIQKTVGRKSATPEEAGANETVPDVTLPEKQGSIKTESISFKSIQNDKLHPEKNQAVIDTMKKGFSAASKERYEKYCATMIKDYSDYAKKKFGDQYGTYLGTPIQPDDIQYLVLHLWAVGMNVGDTVGRSHNTTMQQMLDSWADAVKDTNRPNASIQYMLSDNPDGELWRLTDREFNIAMHAGYGIQDEAGIKTHPNVKNHNSIGLEVQADSIYNVTAKQFESLVYWTTKMLLDSGKVSEGMTRTQINKIVDDMVIGHGKNQGREFGYQFSRPIIAAIQQFSYIAVNG